MRRWAAAAGLATALAEGLGFRIIKAAQVISLLVVQWRCIPRLMARITTEQVRVERPEELWVLQEGVGNGRLEKDVEIGGRLLTAGTRILATADELTAAELPFKLHYRRDRSSAGPPGSRQRLSSALRAAALLEQPLLFWGWSRLTVEGTAWLLHNSLAQWMSKKDIMVLEQATEKISTIINFTALAWYTHLVISWWKDQRSRGRAELSDILGSQSSLREAQINALKVFLQVVTWSLYCCAVMWAVGVNLGKVLLFPSAAAVVVGWVGREIVANLMSGVVIHLTQPFAQGDWVTLESGSIDGWVQEIGIFYTRVVQWDKRPMYVPNFKIMTMNVQNNSRMTHRRIIFELRLRLKDIPVIPAIVQEIQEMIENHEDVDTDQHRLVRWRSIGEFAAEIWVSCYTQPTLEGIRLATYTRVQQSVLERCSGIIYKNGAQFASATDRYAQATEASDSKALWFQVPSFSGGERESQLESREQALRQREKGLKEKERDLEATAALQQQKERDISKAADRYRQLLQTAVHRQEDQATAAPQAPAPSQPPVGLTLLAAGTAWGSAPEGARAGDEEATAEALAADAGEGAAAGAQEVPHPPALADAPGRQAEDCRFRALETALEAAEAALEARQQPPSEEQAPAKQVAAAGDGGEELDATGPPASIAASGAGPSAATGEEAAAQGQGHPDKAEEAKEDEHGNAEVRDGEAVHIKEGEATRIPVKEMGD